MSLKEFKEAQAIKREEAKEVKRIEKEEKELAKEIAKHNKEVEKYMAIAVKEAKKAYDINEVPIGCVIVQDDKVIAKGYNRRNIEKMVFGHAEISAIKQACKKTGDWRLEDCTMYVTLEPCQMCAGAIVQSRMKKVVVGAMNPKAGCAGSIINLLQMEQFNHQVELETGVLEAECQELMTSFFEELRKSKA